MKYFSVKCEMILLVEYYFEEVVDACSLIYSYRSMKWVTDMGLIKYFITLLYE
jgi:hypothetical protein